MIAFLIVAHDHPEQCLRLARRLLEAPDAMVAIHYDARSGAFPAPPDARIRIVPDPVAVRWGDISMIDAVMHAIDWLEGESVPYGWLVHLSGHDYPIVAPSAMERHFASAGVDGFIEHEELAVRFAADNHTRYGFAYARLPSLLDVPAARCWRVNALQPWFRIVRTRAGAFGGWRTSRPFGPELRARRGSNWWVLSHRCVRAIRAIVETRPDIRRAYARKLNPDESFMPTLAAATGLPLSNTDVHFIRWPGGDTASPATLTFADLPAMRSSGALFARKFDPNDDALRDALDAFALVPV